MLFDLIKGFKNDVDSHFDQIKEGLRDLKQKFRYLQQNVRSDRDKLQLNPAMR